MASERRVTLMKPIPPPASSTHGHRFAASRLRAVVRALESAKAQQLDHELAWSQQNTYHHVLYGGDDWCNHLHRAQATCIEILKGDGVSAVKEDKGTAACTCGLEACPQGLTAREAAVETERHALDAAELATAQVEVAVSALEAEVGMHESASVASLEAEVEVQESASGVDVGAEVVPRTSSPSTDSADTKDATANGAADEWPAAVIATTLNGDIAKETEASATNALSMDCAEGITAPTNVSNLFKNAEGNAAVVRAGGIDAAEDNDPLINTPEHDHPSFKMTPPPSPTQAVTAPPTSTNVEQSPKKRMRRTKSGTKSKSGTRSRRS